MMRIFKWFWPHYEVLQSPYGIRVDNQYLNYFYSRGASGAILKDIKGYKKFLHFKYTDSHLHCQTSSFFAASSFRPSFVLQSCSGTCRVHHPARGSDVSGAQPHCRVARRDCCSKLNVIIAWKSIVKNLSMSHVNWPLLPMRVAKSSSSCLVLRKGNCSPRRLHDLTAACQLSCNVTTQLSLHHL